MPENPYAPPRADVGDIHPGIAPSRWLSKRLAWLGGLGACTLIAFGGLLPAFKASSVGAHLIDPAGLVMFVCFASMIAYVVVLGMLARGLGRSWLIPCAISCIFFPLGFVGTYLLMRRAVRRAVYR
jgi:hypothetical protein